MHDYGPLTWQLTWTVCALVFAVGCGGATMPPQSTTHLAEEEATAGPSEEAEAQAQGSAQQYAARIADYEDELAESLPSGEVQLSGGTSPGGAERGSRCETAADLTERICELAARICAIADSHPDDDELQDRCVSGSASCERARQHLAAACPEDTL